MDSKTKAARSKASTKYNAANVRQIKLNLNKRTDADIIQALEETDNIQGYIKRLIRADIETKKAADH